MVSWRGVLVGGGLLAVIAGMGLALGSAQMASGAGTARLAMEPASANVNLDSEGISVEIKVSDVENLGAYSLTIRFDKQKLEFASILPGPFLKSTGRSGPCTGPSPGPNGEPAASIANQYGAFVYSCSTNGLVEGSSGTAGPSGSGLIATLYFKPKAAGLADIAFEGLSEGLSYTVRPPDPSIEGDDGNRGRTDLSIVEVECADCPDDEGSLAIPFSAKGAAINIVDPSQPTPTGVPATPTAAVANTTPANSATVRAALGTAVPRGTSVAAVTGSSSGNGSRPSGTLGGQASSGRQPTGPDGAPIAGYGPQDEANPWPMRAGVALALIGGAAMTAGITARRQRM